tara:strand:+ start:2256 stop:2513 length:258 start_codon:yes stop_codon:yes gene_type:complete
MATRLVVKDLLLTSHHIFNIVIHGKILLKGFIMNHNITIQISQEELPNKLLLLKTILGKIGTILEPKLMVVDGLKMVQICKSPSM